MNRKIILSLLIISFASFAAASNGQEAIFEREINDMFLINSQMQDNLGSCDNDRVCSRLSHSADERDQILRDFDTIDNAPEEKERGIRRIRKSVQDDIELLNTQDLSEDTNLNELLQLSEDLEKSSGKALSAVNTLKTTTTARDCKNKCGAEVSQLAQDAQNHNSSRSNSTCNRCTI